MMQQIPMPTLTLQLPGSVHLQSGHLCAASPAASVQNPVAELKRTEQTPYL